MGTQGTQCLDRLTIDRFWNFYFHFFFISLLLYSFLFTFFILNFDVLIFEFRAGIKILQRNFVSGSLLEGHPVLGQVMATHVFLCFIKTSMLSNNQSVYYQ